ncbi:tetratricopeptide repeat protein [Polyangium jinanense]|uniref:Tetratricopeptide repeat protein n=1 Tax=Polyangium jinanense TaxID=2829994 RepID=A0A9X4AWE4_9BACT|nr:tetratricopeptide repeat protein [Polyangium jinanense]MDC3961693.1 tetratricopeptide repeat protein [Polyangium jinanense]MDC3983920.1 tetratricopeptide repeat protein [Polyangium jinanense]MDC3987259.1 tetratricopeptide repeat protein [Polyangium jinanense]
MTRAKAALSRGALALVAAAAFFGHARAIGAGFVFDDRGAIQENPVVQGDLDLGALFGSDFWGRPPGEGPGTWRPLVVLSFWLNKHITGGFHETNLLLHAATSVVLALALSRHTGRTTFAVVAAMVFGVLGVNTEAVVGLVGRADVMAAGLGWLAWFVAGRADEPEEPRSSLWAALAFAGALASKESAIVFPLFLFLADRLLAPPGRAPRILSARYGSLVAAAVLVIALRTVAFASPLAAVSRELQANPLLAEGWGPRIFTSLRLFAMALGKIVLPVGLSADYSYAAILPEHSPFALPVLVGALVLVGLVVLSIRLRRREPLFALAAVMVLVPWIVMSQLPFVLPTIFAERLLYLPAAGFALMVARIGEWMLERTPGGLVFPAASAGKGKKRAAQKRPKVEPANLRSFVLVLGPVMLANLALAWSRAADWENDRTLFASAMEVVPRSARAHHNYGSALLNEGKSAASIASFERAVEILPTWSEPHAQLGVAMLDTGRVREAEEHFRKAVELDPDSTKAVFNLSVFLARQGRLEEVRANLAPFVERHPNRAREAALLRQIEADLRSPQRP